MRVLLDAAAFWWLAIDSPRLSPTARRTYADPGNEIALSPVSIWELLVKQMAGKLPTDQPLDELLKKARNARAIRSMPLTEPAVLRLATLPSLLADPFDRMLICQALDSGMTILTPDTIMRQYPVPTIW
ncbi:MAG: type II toxin-antitoxin system VapC family toxin [Planctomycetes bacterium]|nr:type II toxin-antitoxin system VapC family toxin [Planctomycetota bacterium]